MNIVEGDIIAVAHAHAKDRRSACIVHQTNCQRIAGAGLAKQIRDTFPRWWAFYRTDIFNTPGRATECWVEDPHGYPNGGLFVVNLYAQVGIGRGVQTDYARFESALQDLKRLPICGYATMQVFVPFGIGCGLAGGDWSVILPLLEHYVPNATLVKLPRK